jgi:hypothetical protein
MTVPELDFYDFYFGCAKNARFVISHDPRAAIAVRRPARAPRCLVAQPCNVMPPALK